MEMIGSLTAHYSKRDRNGNCYWALEYTDFKTGRMVCGTVSGGESNIYQVIYKWQGAESFHRGIVWRVQEHGIRDFNRMTKEWAHAGCSGDELQRFIVAGLAAEPVAA
jgi:hypothetical protein